MIDFSDLYIPEDDPMSGHYFPGPILIPDSMRDFVFGLVEKSQKQNQINFAIEHEGVFFRCHRMPTITGVLYVYRKMPSEAWSMDRCGFPKYLKDYMLSDRLSKGGLVIVAGMPGNGKSTSCAAMIKDRLEQRGGLCITIEDPPEMKLQGTHGKGICFQRGVESDEDFNAAVKDAMRAYPTQVDTMMLIGEVRDPETASLVVKSSIDGRLVFVTTHSGNVIQALHRITSLAAEEMGYSEARELISSSLRLIIHQKITNEGLSTNILLDTDGVAAVIRNKDMSYESLNNEVSQQAKRLRMGASIQLRKVE